RHFPLEFRRQPHAGPPGIRVGLEIAQMRHRRRRIDFDAAAQRERRPATVALLPVARRHPPLSLCGVPTEREPELGPAVAAAVNEGKEFSVRHRSRRELVRREKHRMAWQFIVEAETVAGVTYVDKPTGIAYPSRLLRLDGRQRPTLEIGRL